MDGGATRNDLLMQFQADILGVPVVRPKMLESTALGAAFLAGLGVGFWRDAAEIDGQWKARARVRAGHGRGAARRPAGRLASGAGAR